MFNKIVTAHWNKNGRHGGFTKDEIEAIMLFYQEPCLHLFSGSSTIGNIRVDLWDESPATHHEEVLSFLEQCDDNSFNMVIADPPYNKRNEKRYGSSFWMVGADTKKTSKLKSEIKRVLRPSGIVVFKHWFDFAPGKNYELLAQIVTKYGGFRRITILTIYKKLELSKKNKTTKNMPLLTHWF